MFLLSSIRLLDLQTFILEAVQLNTVSIETHTHTHTVVVSVKAICALKYIRVMAFVTQRGGR